MYHAIAAVLLFALAFSQSAVAGDTTRVVVVADSQGDPRFTTTDGSPITLDSFLFDLATGWSGAEAVQTTRERQGVPVPLRVGLPSSPTDGRIRISAIFANTSIELRGVTMFPLGVLQSTSGIQLAFISITPGESNSFQIGANYVVSTTTRQSDTSSSSFHATILFPAIPTVAGQFRPSPGKLKITRNGKPFQEVADLTKTATVMVDNVQISSDRIDWVLETSSGAVMRTGSLGIPVASRTRGVVTYELLGQWLGK